MLHVQTVPLLLSILGASLLGLLLWGFLQARNHQASDPWLVETRNDPLVWLLVLAAFTTGVFLAYVLLT